MVISLTLSSTSTANNDQAAASSSIGAPVMMDTLFGQIKIGGNAVYVTADLLFSIIQVIEAK